MFIVEGIATVVIGIAIWFLLPDCKFRIPQLGIVSRLTKLLVPPQAKWLTDDEKAFIQARLPGNAPQSKEANFRWREILDVLKDVKTWLFTLCWAFFTVGSSGLQFYLPTVIADLGFTTVARSQLLNIPTAVLTIGFIAAFGLWADTARLPRPLFPLSFLIVIMACYSVLFTFPSTGAVYATSILATALASSWYPMMWPWRVQTTSKATGSAFAIGFVNSYGQIGGALGPQIFRQKYAPRYRTSFGTAMAIIGLAIITNLTTWWVTNDVEVETRRLKRARIEAAKRGEVVLDDVDFDGKQGSNAMVRGYDLEGGPSGSGSEIASMKGGSRE